MKTIPEGGYYALPELYADGAMLVGDSAGMVNMKKIKGVHYAIRAGMGAADTAFDAIQKGDYSKVTLQAYRQGLEESQILPDLYQARCKFRQAFKFGLFLRVRFFPRYSPSSPPA